ncbi:MAG TPA: 5'-3' exonuclease H3TH domain-containing protein [Verrucomicrobiae bacterium]|nr:5'-3' exonuclease H3TH domain-containing protein [Verrucomicrobiae bacterium]
MGDTLLLFDAYSLIYRAFYAIRKLTGPDGEPVNAVYGLTKMLRKMIATHNPVYCAAVFDLGAPRKRLRLLSSYKAQRPPTPPDLEKQLPAIREVLQGMRVPAVEIEGEEADDVIATLAVRAAHAGHEVLIASNDKDFMQIVSPHIRLLRPDGKETVLIDPAGVEARCGVKPEQIVDYLSLIGDSVDNIPGAPGVGEKTAAQLLQTYGTLDDLLTHAGDITKPRLRDTLLAAAEHLRLNRRLIALQTDVPTPVTTEALKIQPPDAAVLAPLYRRLGFKSLLAELEKPADPAAGERDLFAPK